MISFTTDTNRPKRGVSAQAKDVSDVDRP